MGQARDDGRSVTDPDHVSLADAYALETPDDNRDLYARWAHTYDAEFVEAEGYVYPLRIADIFTGIAAGRHLAATPDNPLLDVGCGTGIIAVGLTGQGARWVIDGVDISRPMLDRAATKKRPDGSDAYRQLFEADLTKPVDVLIGHYRAVLSAGTFTHGHLGPEALDGMIRFGRAGAVFVIGINAEHYRTRGFSEYLDDLVAKAVIHDVQTLTIDIYVPESPHSGDKGIVAVFTSAS